MIEPIDEGPLICRNLANFDLTSWVEHYGYGSDNLQEAIAYAKADFQWSSEKTYRTGVKDRNGKILFLAERVDGVITKYWEVNDSEGNS